MASLPSDFQQRVKLYQKSGLESSLGKFTNTTAQTDALKSYLGGGSTSSSGGNLDSIINQSIKRIQEANAPAIQSLQASIPETQAKFAQTREQLSAETEPLKARYENLLNQIKGKEQVATNRQTVATQNELGRRGIQGGGLAEQTLADALNPITSEYAGLTKETGLAQEADLRNLQNQIAGLTTQETDATRAIQNAIAQLQAGGNQSAITNALNQFQTLQGVEQFNQNLALQKAAQALAEKQYNEVTLPASQASLAKSTAVDPNQALLSSLINNILGRFGNTSTNANFSSSSGQQYYIPTPSFIPS